MEDTSILWPFSVEATSIEESIPFFEEEVIINELLSILCRKRVERVVGSLKFAIKF